MANTDAWKVLWGDVKVHASSVEPVYIAVRIDDPITDEVALSALTVEVACPIDGVAPSVWSAGTWATGQWLGPNGLRYYLVPVRAGSTFTLVNDTTYQPWTRVTITGSDKFYYRAAGRIVVDNT